MAKITSSATSFSDTAINVNNSGVSIAMGNTIAVTIGMSNSVFLGAKTSLTGGAQTNITLGPSSSFTYGNVLSATYGNSWSWSATNNTIYDSASRWGVKSNTYNGGISTASYAERWAEGSQGKIITLGVFVSYLAMVGLSCVGIACPAFTPTSSTDSSPKYSSTNAAISIISDTLGMVLLAYAQYRAVQFLWNWRNFLPVTTLGLTSQGLSSFVYPYPDKTITSPFASFVMLPGAADGNGPSFLEGYSNDAIPSISLKSSLSPAMNTSSSLTINPTGVIIASNYTTGGPQVSLSSNGSGRVTIVNNSDPAQTNVKGSISINNSTTSLYRPQGTISLAVGSGATTSSIKIKNNSIKLASSGASSGSLLVDSSGVTIGTGPTAAKFTSSNVTIGGSTGITLTGSSINIGGAIVITGAALNTSLGSAITSAKQEMATSITEGDTALQELLTQANLTIQKMNLEIIALRASQEEQKLATALLAAQINGGGGGE